MVTVQSPEEICPLFPALGFMVFTILRFFMTNHDLSRLLTRSLQTSLEHSEENQEDD